MRAFVGWWLESKKYTNQANVPRDQEPDTVDGAVPIRYDLVEKKLSRYENGMKSEKTTTIIDTDIRVNIKLNDRIYVGDWLKVVGVDISIPKGKENIIKMWPKRINKIANKRVSLE